MMVVMRIGKDAPISFRIEREAREPHSYCSFWHTPMRVIHKETSAHIIACFWRVVFVGEGICFWRAILL